MTLTLTIFGCGFSAGVPRPALGWGACDPGNSKNRRRRCSLLVERRSGSGRDPDCDRYLARSARAVDRRRGRPHRCGVSHPRARRPDPRHRRSPLGRAASAATHPGLSQSIDRRSYPAEVFILFRLAAGQRLSADPGQPSGRGRRKPHRRREGRSRSRCRPSSCSTARFPRSVTGSATRRIRPTSATFRPRAGRHLENLELWIIDGLRYTWHPSHFSVDDALSWIARFKPRRAVITNMHSDLDYEVLRQSLPPNAPSPPMTACG